MAQHDYDLANAAGATFRADANNALLAIVSQNYGLTEPATMFAYQWWADGTTGYLKQRNAANTGWIIKQKLSSDMLAAIQKQEFTAFTSAGTSTAYTLTTVPAMAALTTNEMFRVNFHTASGAAPTLARDGLTAKLIKQYDSTGAKVTATLAANQLTIVEYDGTDYVVLNPLPPALSPITIRQTVELGPVDTSGFSAFGGSTGSTTVTASGTLYLNAANGMVNRRGSITNPSWTGASTNGTMYAYLDIAADGSCTTGLSTLAPDYRWGGADVVTSGQFTFNIQEMTGKVGNGATAVQTYRVYVGEFTVAGNVVTAIVWYALMGRYDSGKYSFAFSTAYVKNHNLGLIPKSGRTVIVNTTAEHGYSIGDELEEYSQQNGTVVNSGIGIAYRSNTASATTQSTINITNLSTGATAQITAANWNIRHYIGRGW